jgi:C-terminal processing protease CtpA/Prc
LQLIAGGTALNKFIVQGVAPNSPASEAGFAPGDRILKVGFWPASFYGLDDIQQVLKKAPNKKITLTIRRDGRKMRKTLVLRNLI